VKGKKKGTTRVLTSLKYTVFATKLMFYLVYPFRKERGKWTVQHCFSCFIVENLSITVFCGLTGVQDYPMLSFLETGSQVIKKGGACFFLVQSNLP